MIIFRNEIADLNPSIHGFVFGQNEQFEKYDKSHTMTKILKKKH